MTGNDLITRTMNQCIRPLPSSFKTLDNKSTQTIINEELSKINEWLNINNLLLNKSKTKYMVFHMPNKRMQALTLKIDDVYIYILKE